MTRFGCRLFTVLLTLQVAGWSLVAQVAPPAPANDATERMLARWADRELQQVPPFRIFDNLYYVGLEWVSCYLLVTSDGLILIDGLYGDYTEHAIAGIRSFGFDPADVRYVIATHGHFDHAAGATTFQERWGASVAMTEADWQLALGPPSPRLDFGSPRRDLVLADGDTVRLGDTSVEVYVTPGHTEGVLSMDFEVQDGTNRHRAFVFGGVGLNFDGIERTEAYLRSVDRVRRLSLAGDSPVAVNVTNHPGPGGIFERRDRLGERAPDAPHPFVDPRGFQTWLDGLQVAAEDKLRAELAAAGHTLPAQTRAAIDALFAEWDRDDTPGAALGIIRDGDLVYARGYGQANLDYRATLGPSSPFYIASTSKQFTATAVALLALDGKLALDDDIRKWIPEIPQYQRPITVRHLIHHTSGLRDYLSLMSVQGRSFEDSFTNDDAVALLAKQRGLNFPPGSAYLYSNSNYALLVTLIERVTGKSAQELADQRIFQPLGMYRTHWGDDPHRVERGRVTSYAPTSPTSYRRFIHNFTAHGDGNLWSTVEDLARWDRNFETGAVGGKELLALQLERGVLDDGTRIQYAFGLAHGEHGGRPMVAHGGAFLGFRTELVRFPAQRTSVIVLSNLATFDAGAKALAVADILLGAASAEPAANAPEVEVPLSILETYTGDYLDEGRARYRKLVVAHGALELRGAGPPVRLRARARDRFGNTENGIEIELLSAGPGQTPTAMNVALEPEPPTRRYERITPLGEPPPFGPYLGHYRSDELDLEAEVTENGGALRLRASTHGPAVTLRPLDADRFDGSFAVVVFKRDREGRIARFVLNTGRANGLEFERTP